MSGPAEGREARLHISVVVPSWRDGKNLAILLPALSRLEGVAETIVVDAGADPEAERIALSCGATFIGCPAPNRGEQMNLGAAAASGDTIVFQHSDTNLTEEHIAAIECVLSDPAISGGAGGVSGTTGCLR